MPLSLGTQRLIVRPFQDADLPPFVAYRSDPEIARYQSWDAPYTMARAAALIAEMQRIQPGEPGQWYQLAIEMKASGQMIGDCAFCVLADDPRQAEIGFTLARSFHGCGYATEAVTRLLAYLFGDLQLHRVRATCDPENVASAALLERIGMRHEGHSQESLWFKGQWASEYWYAMLRREWMAKRDGARGTAGASSRRPRQDGRSSC